MPTATITDLIAAERQALATLLSGLPPQQWDAPTLCAGWRVREVVAHITMPFRYSPDQYLRELAEWQGDFDRMSDHCARRDAAVPVAELVAAVADNVHHPWQPPGGGYEAALTHDVIHGLDITVPLGTGRRVPEPHLIAVLDTLTARGGGAVFGTDLAGVELRADDLDWSLGSGEPVSGLAQHLLLAMAGRKLPAGLLRGNQAGRFSAP
ncbi:MAG TPA: maleylpyruvate isomerase family mycothiol-dependent enzyme [Streptosporangiaceae bacterium]